VGRLKRFFNNFRLNQTLIRLKPGEKLVVWLTVREGYELDSEGYEAIKNQFSDAMKRIGIGEDQATIIICAGFEQPAVTKRLKLVER
jgi:translation elongation factor EF-1alpha